MANISLFCPEGHRVTDHDARFCATCGAALSARCNRCQTALAVDATSCEMCDAAELARREAAQQAAAERSQKAEAAAAARAAERARRAAEQGALRTTPRESPPKRSPLVAVVITAAIVGGLALSGTGIWLFMGSDGESGKVSLALAPEPKEVPPSPPSGGTGDLTEEEGSDITSEPTPSSTGTPGPRPPASPTEGPSSGHVIRSTSFRVPLTIEVPAGWQVGIEREEVFEIEAGEDSPYFRTAWLNISYVADTSSGPMTPEDVILEVVASSEGALKPLGVPGPTTLFGRPASAIDMRAPQDVAFADGFMGGNQFFAGDRLHFVAGQTGTSLVLVYAEGQTSQWDSLWPVFRAMIESISPG